MLLTMPSLWEFLWSQPQAAVYDICKSSTSLPGTLAVRSYEVLWFTLIPHRLMFTGQLLGGCHRNISTPHVRVRLGLRGHLARLRGLGDEQ